MEILQMKWVKKTVVLKKKTLPTKFNSFRILIHRDKKIRQSNFNSEQINALRRFKVEYFILKIFTKSKTIAF